VPQAGLALEGEPSDGLDSCSTTRPAPSDGVDLGLGVVGRQVCGVYLRQARMEPSDGSYLILISGGYHRTASVCGVQLGWSFFGMERSTAEIRSRGAGSRQ
jgi:hypothetical protein